MIPGAISSVVIAAIGAILYYAVTVNSSGFNIHTVGIILMIAGAVGFVVSILGFSFMRGSARHRHVITEDSNGNVVRQEETIQN